MLHPDEAAVKHTHTCVFGRAASGCEVASGHTNTVMVTGNGGLLLLL